MLFRHAFPSPTGCKAYRLALQNTVAFSANATQRPALMSRCLFPSNNRRQVRQLTYTGYQRSDFVRQRSDHDGSLVEEAAFLEVEQTDDFDENPVPSTSPPWYLQFETPLRESNPLLDRQQIPELPPDPPPLLKPMLENISIDLGLDDLTILDLRELDPPPALGANLVMIIGTARSEKHLHVSADRFCRWLKTTHKLSPHADGILGRGELKLKLRRKARRAKLLSSVGSSETGTADDGIRTGWICVTAENIEDGSGTSEKFTDQGGYVGFGGEALGAKVVFQMLTQEKREELDLEDLWGKTLRRHEKREGRISASQGKHPRKQEVGQLSPQGQHSAPDISLFSPSRPLQPVAARFNQVNQVRRFHSTLKSLPLRLTTKARKEVVGNSPSVYRPRLRTSQDTQLAHATN